MGAFRWKCALPGGAARILRPAREGFMGGHPAFGKTSSSLRNSSGRRQTFCGAANAWEWFDFKRESGKFRFRRFVRAVQKLCGRQSGLEFSVFCRRAAAEFCAPFRGLPLAPKRRLKSVGALRAELEIRPVRKGRGEKLEQTNIFA